MKTNILLVNALNNYNDTRSKDTYHLIQRLIIQIIVGYTYHDRIFHGQHPLTVFSSTKLRSYKETEKRSK